MREQEMGERNTESPRRRRRSRGYWRIFLVLGGLFVALLLLVVMALFRTDSNTESIPGPKTYAELNEYYAAVPDDQNAGLKFDQLVQSGKIGPIHAAADRIVDFEHKGWLPEGQELPDLVPLLEQSKEGLEELHALLQLEHSRFPIDLAEGPGVRLGHLTTLRTICRAEKLIALQKIEAGDVEGSYLHLRDCWRIGRLLKHEPILYSQLVRIATHGIAVDATARVVAHGGFTDAQLQDLAKAALDERDPDLLFRALLGERAFYLGNGYATDGFGQSVMVSLGYQFFMRVMNDILRASQLPDLDIAPAFDKINAELKKAENASVLSQTINMIPLMVLPGYARASDALLRDRATIDVFVLGMAIERYKLANGVPPDTLDQLVPAFIDAVPVDIFANEPCKYLRLPDGYVVYSIGPDRTDNSGLEREAGAKGKREWDIPFRVPPAVEEEPADELSQT